MSLKVWLPLNGDLKNQGCTGYTITAIEASPTFTTGKIGQCYQRANTSSQITNGLQIQDNLVSTFGTTASVAVWVKPLGTHTHYNGTILSSGNWNAKRWAFGVSQDNSQVDVLCGGYNNYISCAVPVNQWTHLASTFENGVCKLYKNGVYVGEKSGQAAFDSDANWTGICRETYAGGYFGFNGCINDLRIYDHVLSAAEVKEISQGLVLHYPLNRQSLKPIGTNLVTGVTKGGQTALLTDGRVGVVTSGTSADTYFTVNLSESITNGTTYYLSCDVSGISEGQYWGFPLGAQNNTSMPSKFYNGHNEYVFTANNIDWGANRLFLDDNYRNDYAHPASFYNFVLIKNPTFEEMDESGYGNNGVSNVPVTTSSETGRYKEASYFGAYNTPSITVNNFSTISPALTTGTITWWGKYDTTTTLLFTGQTTSYYIAASANNNYYHANIGSPTMYKDGVAGTYKCAADGWHHFALTGVNLSTWTALKLNGYSSSWPLKGYISDLRIYNTVLSAADILQLCHTSAKIDNKANFHTYEINENDTNKLTKTGIMYDNMEESIMTLPDGSHWQLLMFHYVDDGKNLFTSSNASNCNNFGLFSRLKDIDGFKLNNQYEFYAIQDGTAYRWIQTNAPLTTTAVAGFSAVSGYNSPGAGICKCNGNTLLARTNTTGNWWNAFGCYTLYSGGIPGLNSVVCKKYLALYARIEKADVKLSNQTANVSEFIEL